MAICHKRFGVDRDKGRNDFEATKFLFSREKAPNAYCDGHRFRIKKKYLRQSDNAEKSHSIGLLASVILFEINIQCSVISPITTKHNI